MITTFSFFLASEFQATLNQLPLSPPVNFLNGSQTSFTKLFDASVSESSSLCRALCLIYVILPIPAILSLFFEVRSGPLPSLPTSFSLQSLPDQWRLEVGFGLFGLRGC